MRILNCSVLRVGIMHGDDASQTAPPSRELLAVRTALRELVQKHVKAIRMCLDNDPPGSALILVYATVDTLASLGLPARREIVKRQDFIAWVDRNFLPDSGLRCTAVDLYGARCGVLHSNRAKLSLSHTGDASPLLYAWGTAAEATSFRRWSTWLLPFHRPRWTKPETF